MSECEETVQPDKSSPHVAKHFPGRIDTCAHWSLYDRALKALEDANVPFAVGGAFALGVYTSFYRDTKDLDLYLVPSDRERAIKAILSVGPIDLHSRYPYDQNWIFRACWDDVVIDLIWRFANYVADVDDDWLRFGKQIEIGGHLVRAIPAEELLWAKLYIVQRHRCDWTDLLNLLYAAAGDLDWSRLMIRVNGDRALMAGLLSIFSWICPGRVDDIPAWVWDSVGVRPLSRPGDVDVDPARVAYLDSRPWFFANMS